MPTDLGHSFSPLWKGRPPHMSALDYQLWLVWMPRHLDDFSEVYYDVGLGDPGEFFEIRDPKLHYMWVRLNQRRADMLGIKDDRIAVIEFRTQARASSVGRLLHYQQLLANDNPFKKPIEMWLVTDMLDESTRKFAAHHNLKVFEC